MKEIRVPAQVEQLEVVNDFVAAELEMRDCSPKIQMQVALAVEEIFMNIANYAYNPEVGEATIRCCVGGEPLHIEITFLDDGKPYDPLAKEDPDITLSAEEREIGGLGVFLVKKLMDDVRYEYKDGSNILTVWKTLAE